MPHVAATAMWIALQVWGPAPCGQVGVQWQDLGASRLGTAAVPCMVTLNSRKRDVLRNWDFLCTTIVHEWGHLAGQKHSADPDNVMYEHAVRYWRCDTKRGVFGFRYFKYVNRSRTESDTVRPWLAR